MTLGTLEERDYVGRGRIRRCKPHGVIVVRICNRVYDDVVNWEIVNFILGILALVVGGVAHVRITSFKSKNKVGDMSQSGSHNQQAGRDIR